VPSITDFAAFLDLEEPETASDLADLALCASGPNEAGHYYSQADSGGRLFITGSGRTTLVLASPAARHAFMTELKRWTSEKGATFEGDAAFERAMLKDD
jgi:hypothetical protein